MEYDCASAVLCNSLIVSDGRVRNLRFSKVTLRQVASSGPLSGVVLPASTVSPFASAPVYLCGSMNQWGVTNQLQAAGDKKLSARIMLEPGAHEFKIASHDYSEIDLGGMPGVSAMAPGHALTMEAGGANIRLNVPARAAYEFALDVSDPEAPVLTLKR